MTWLPIQLHTERLAPVLDASRVCEPRSVAAAHLAVAPVTLQVPLPLTAPLGERLLCSYSAAGGCAGATNLRLCAFCGRPGALLGGSSFRAARRATRGVLLSGMGGLAHGKGDPDFPSSQDVVSGLVHLKCNAAIAAVLLSDGSWPGGNPGSVLCDGGSEQLRYVGDIVGHS